MPPPYEYDVFLSHGSDDKPRVRRLAQQLRGAGLRVWLDEREILPGGRIVAGIQEGLASSRVVVLCMSPAALASPWVQAEHHGILTEDPRNQDRRVVPLLLVDCEIPPVLRQYRYIDYRGESEAAFAELVAACRDGTAGFPQAYDESTDRRSLTPPGLLRQALDRLLPGLHRWLTRVGTLPEPPELGELREYLRELRAALRAELREKTYVPLAGRPVPPSGPLAFPAVEHDPFVAPIHQMILQIIGRMEGGDSATAQIAAVNRRSRLVRDVLRLVQESREPLVLLGEPGSGKTMTLQQAAIRLAERESARVFPRVPLYVRLGEFHVDGGRVESSHVRAYVEHEAPRPIRPWLHALAEHDRLVLLFDGMDEMSRERYGDHTEALSRFADGSPARTLFTCRITDFSPRFVHRRLVVLPFNREQVAEYLRRYVNVFPVTIDGEPWTLRRLAGHVTHGSLPVEADNPFVLWLLCLFLQEHGTWPQSRVELLRFYNEQNYRRKEAELPEGELPLPEMERAFTAWARFAYAITERNRGPAIPVARLPAGGEPVAEMVRAGKRCGVLRESRDGGEHLVRFEHHRFQEFFTALHVHTRRPQVDWLVRLDAPRWQETMLNLILMGDATTALHTLADAIGTQTRLCEAEVERQQWKLGRVLEPKEEVHLPDEHESVLADRVELASRILHQTGPGASAVREALAGPFHDAVAVLAANGTPVTQVKMMRASQNVLDANLLEALRKPLGSPIHWVRNQALIVIASAQRSSREAGPDLATEIGLDLANGTALSRVRAYWKAARASRIPKAWLYLAAGVCGQALALAPVLAAAALLYFAGWVHGGDLFRTHSPGFVPPDFSVLGRAPAVVAWAAMVAIAMGAALRLRPAWTWLAITAATGSVVTVLPLLAVLWRGEWPTAIFAFVLPFYAIILCYGAGAMPAMAGHWGILAVYLMLTRRARRPGITLTTFFSAAWKAGSFANGLKLIGVCVCVGIVAVAGPAIQRLLILLNRHLGLPFSPQVTFMILAFAFPTVTLLWTGFVRARELERSSGRAALRARMAQIAKYGLGVAAGVAVILLLARGVVQGFGLAIDPWAAGMLGIALAICAGLTVFTWREIRDVGQKGPGWGVLAGIAIVASVVGALFWMQEGDLVARGLVVTVPLVILGIAVARGAWLLPAAVRFGPWGGGRIAVGAFTPEVWKTQVARLGPYQQEHLLFQTDPHSLSLTAADYLELLKEVRPSIKHEPALSTYWELRSQLEEILKQERQG